MSVNVNNTNQSVNIGNIKKLKASSTKAAQLRMPEYLTSQGSIFNAPGVDTNLDVKKTAPQKTGQTSKNAETSLQKSVFGNNNNNNNINFITSGNKNQVNQAGMVQYQGVNGLASCLDENIAKSLDIKGNEAKKEESTSTTNISSGNALSQAKSMQSSLGSLKSDVGGIQTAGNEINSIGNKSEKLVGKLDKADEKFQAAMKKQQKELDKLNKETQSLINELNRNTKEANDLNKQLEEELASDNPDQDKVASFRCAINEKQSVINVSGKKVYVISRKSKNLVNSMYKTSKSYAKDVKETQAEQKVEQTKAEKVIETSTKIGLYAGIVQMGGKVLGLIADMLIAGTYTAAAGAVLKPIASTIEAVGGWGKCACEAVNAVAYASEGKIGMALVSAGSAVMSGLSAYDASKTAVSGFKNMSANIDAAKANAETVKAASDAGARAENEALGVDKAKEEAIKAGKSDAEIEQAGKDAAKSASKETRAAAEKAGKEAEASYLKNNLKELNFGKSSESWQKTMKAVKEVTPSIQQIGSMVSQYEAMEQAQNVQQQQTSKSKVDPERARRAEANARALLAQEVRRRPPVFL